MQKEAILSKLLASLRHPANKAAREALATKARASLQKNINGSIRKGLKAAKVDKGIGKTVSVLTADVPGTPRLIMKNRSKAVRDLVGAKLGKDTVEFISQNPELIPTLPLPIPGITPALMGVKRGLKRALNVPPSKLTKSAAMQSFVDELVKISESISSLKELKKKLEPGDILYSTLRSPTKVSRIFRAALRSKYTHTGIYTGRSVINAAYPKVKRESLKSFASLYDFKVLRPETTKKAKKGAISWAKKQIGKNYNLKGAIITVIPGKLSGTRSTKKRVKKNSLFCSELVANAYAPYLKFTDSRKVKHTLPGHIAYSDKTQLVADFKKESTAHVKAHGSKRVAKMHKGVRRTSVHKSWKF